MVPSFFAVSRNARAAGVPDDPHDARTSDAAASEGGAPHGVAVVRRRGRRDSTATRWATATTTETSVGGRRRSRSDGSTDGEPAPCPAPAAGTSSVDRMSASSSISASTFAWISGIVRPALTATRAAPAGSRRAAGGPQAVKCRLPVGGEDELVRRREGLAQDALVVDRDREVLRRDGRRVEVPEISTTWIASATVWHDVQDAYATAALPLSTTSPVARRIWNASLKTSNPSLVLIATAVVSPPAYAVHANGTAHSNADERQRRRGNIACSSTARAQRRLGRQRRLRRRRRSTGASVDGSVDSRRPFTTGAGSSPPSARPGSGAAGSPATVSDVSPTARTRARSVAVGDRCRRGRDVVGERAALARPDRRVLLARQPRPHEQPDEAGADEQHDRALRVAVRRPGPRPPPDAPRRGGRSCRRCRRTAAAARRAARRRRPPAARARVRRGHRARCWSTTPRRSPAAAAGGRAAASG
jgi:hypothetical protein